MNFKEAFENYKNGNANDIERQFVEEELEKNRLINDLLNDEWEQSAPVAIAPKIELKKVKRRLMWRNVAIVLISIGLCVALYFVAMYVVVPYMEKQYWDPEETSYSVVEDDDSVILTDFLGSDLYYNMYAFSELFMHGLSVNHLETNRNSFANYSLTLYCDDIFKGGTTYFYGTIDKGELTIPKEYNNNIIDNAFAGVCFMEYPMDEEWKENTYNRLKKLPDYMLVDAAVTFAEDMNMDELIEFNENSDAFIEWVGIRHCNNDEQLYPYCGIKPFKGGVVFKDFSEEYPYFNITAVQGLDEEMIERHLTSLLKYSLDQKNKGRGLREDMLISDDDDAPGYHQSVLNYIEENGLSSYGCFMYSSPEYLIELLDSGIASQVYINDIKISTY